MNVNREAQYIKLNHKQQRAGIIDLKKYNKIIKTMNKFTDDRILLATYTLGDDLYLLPLDRLIDALQELKKEFEIQGYINFIVIPNDDHEDDFGRSIRIYGEKNDN